MTRFVVSVLPEAEADIRATFLRYRERNMLAADGIRSEILEVIGELIDRAKVGPCDGCGVHDRVTNHPKSGCQVRRHGRRSWLSPRRPLLAQS